MTRFVAIASVLISLFVALYMNHHRAQSQGDSLDRLDRIGLDRFLARQKDPIAPESSPGEETPKPNRFGDFPVGINPSPSELLAIALTYERGLNAPCCGRFPRLKNILLDQDFEGLSDLAKKQVLVQVYPDFARLPTLEQDKVIEFAHLLTPVIKDSPCWIHVDPH